MRQRYRILSASAWAVPTRPLVSDAVSHGAGQFRQAGNAPLSWYKGTAILREAFARRQLLYGVNSTPSGDRAAANRFEEGIMHVCMTDPYPAIRR